jgi:hypothetical protein
MIRNRRRFLPLLLWLIGLTLLFSVYTSDLARNPPGFYVDESACAYNAYLVAHTGAGEFGPRFPLMFQFYTDGFAQYADSAQTYLLAIVFRIFSPSIWLVRMFSALGVFAACILLGFLARRISGRWVVGVIVAVAALVTPWFFEARGLLLGPQFVPLVLALILLMVYRVRAKEFWSWGDIALLVGTLVWLTYCYNSGRVLAPLLALGLLFFATTWRRLISVVTTGLLYGVTLVPVLVFNWRNPGALTRRLYEISYIKPGVPWSDIASQFMKRYLEDQSLMGLLVNGDYHPRHHVQGSGGAFFIATFVLAMIGLVIIITRHRSDPWWRFVLYGLLVAIIPGAISIEPFHAMRLMAYPVFLLILTVPALEWLVARGKPKSDLALAPSGIPAESSFEKAQPLRPEIAGSMFPRPARLLILCALLAFMTVETYWFQLVFRREGPKRWFEFDVGYKEAYDTATKQPLRPIYLEDGKWGPAYIHAFWYATVEKRPTSQFVHLSQGIKPPPGVIVISSAEQCENCETIIRNGVYHVYKTL